MKRSHIAIDGKCLRGTKTFEYKAKDIVTAYNCDNTFVVSQKEVQEKKNEVSAILQLLEEIDPQW